MLYGSYELYEDDGLSIREDRENLITKEHLGSAIFDYLVQKPELDELGEIIYKDLKDYIINGIHSDLGSSLTWVPGVLDSLFSGNFEQILQSNYML